MKLSQKNYYAGLVFQTGFLITLSSIYSPQVAFAVMFGISTAYFLIMSIVTEGR